MSEPFKKQSGASNSDPKPLTRWIMSKLFMSRFASGRYQKKQHQQAEEQRRKSQAPHCIEYFHQVDDGYSHLAIQLLEALSKRYQVQIKCYLVSAQKDPNNPEPELLKRLSQYDASEVATHYGLNFPKAQNSPPDEEMVLLAQTTLACMDNETFIAKGPAVSEALWQGNAAALHALATNLASGLAELTQQALEKGNERRKQLAHYSGAMFYYGKEWYWGVDRLYHLEQRLAALGLDKRAGESLLAPRPDIEFGPLTDNGSLTLEVYPSLRSPYTAIVFDRTLELAERTGVKLLVKPVLPMVMRGVPATRQKGMYIMADCGREARAAGVPFGDIYDPIGDPVRRAYSLYPWVCEQGKGNAFLSAFLRLAFAESVNTNNNRGLRRVVEAAGLPWSEAKKRVGNRDWEPLLEQNRQDMYASGLWGVPSFRLLNAEGEPELALWGQDRLWLFSREIQRLLSQ